MNFLRGGLVVLGCGVLVVTACSADSDGTGGDDETGGSATGGTAGANGGSSGTPSSGGSSSGASSGGSGTSGTAGTGGMRGYRPPDNQLDGCTRACELEAAAMCPNETTFEQCVEGCQVGLLFEPCSELWDSVFECVATADEATCNAEGMAFIGECVDEATPAFDCVTTTTAGNDFANSCSSHCIAAAGAMCESGGDALGCSSDCRIIASAFPVCNGAYEEFLTCSGAAEQTCASDGKPTASGCLALEGAFLDCLVADYGWHPGTGLTL
jgi:hypothetical protein